MLADLEVECYKERHLIMVLVVGIFQLLFLVIGLPVTAIYFLYRNREGLTRHVVKTRYGLFLGGYRTERYYWEIMLVMRKVTVIILSVFGTVLSVPIQVHVTSLVILIFMISQAVWKPFGPPTLAQKRRSSNSVFSNVPASRYETLQRLELVAMFVIWCKIFSFFEVFQCILLI